MAEEGGVEERPKEKQNETTKTDDVPYVVEISPGVGGEEDALRMRLPSSMKDATVGEIVEYLVNKAQWGEGVESNLAEIIAKEMENAYKITIGNKEVSENEKLSKYFEDALTKSGKSYRKTYLRIAATRTGGYAELWE